MKITFEYINWTEDTVTVRVHPTVDSPQKSAGAHVFEDIYPNMRVAIRLSQTDGDPEISLSHGQFNVDITVNAKREEIEINRS